MEERRRALSLAASRWFCSLLAGRPALADGVAQILTSKTIPAATVAVIDLETGTSSGGGTTDVKVANGGTGPSRARRALVDLLVTVHLSC